MISHLPYRERLVYLIQTKLQTELPEHIIRDIDYALYEHGKQCVSVCELEKNQWMNEALDKRFK